MNWITKLEGFLTLNDREILQGAGRISAQLAKSHAETEFGKFRILDGIDDQSLDVSRICAWIGDHDDRHRRVKLRVLGARNVLERGEPHAEQQPEQQQRELPAPRRSTGLRTNQAQKRWRAVESS